MWDGMIQREQNGQPVSEEERKQERDKMVDVLNRRNYIRNLVRDVSEVLEEQLAVSNWHSANCQLLIARLNVGLSIYGN